MNIVLREMRANFKSLLIWCISMVALIAVGLVKYAGIAGAGAQAYELVNQLPAAMKDIMELNLFDLTTIAGYFGVFFLYLMMLAGIHAIMLGATIISKEERDKTADFLYVKPVRRSRIITAKLMATLINLIVFNLVTWLASVILIGDYNPGPSLNRSIAYLMMSLFILQVVFAALGTFISGLARNIKKATSIATTVFLIMFMLSMAIDLYNQLDILQYLTPFKYFPIADVMAGQFNPFFLALSLVITVVFGLITYRTYERQDLKI